MMVENYPRRCIWVPMRLNPEDIVDIEDPRDKAIFVEENYTDLQEKIINEDLYTYKCFYDDELDCINGVLEVTCSLLIARNAELKNEDILNFAKANNCLEKDLSFETVALTDFVNTEYVIGIRINK